MAIIDRQRHDISPEEYHKLNAVSSGMLRCFSIDGPWMCYHRFITKTVESSDSDEKRLGRAFHLAMATGDESWRKKYVIIPRQIRGQEINLRKPSHRLYVQEIKSHAAMVGLESLYEEELDPLKSMIDSVFDNPAAHRYIGRGNPEVPMTAMESDTGMAVKALGDIELDDCIVDFKTTRHSTSNEFVRDAIHKGYDYQGAHYCDVFGRDKFVIIGIRNKPPYEAMVYAVPPSRLEKARVRNKAVLQKISDCMSLGSWHSIGWGEENELMISEDPQTGVTWL